MNRCAVLITDQQLLPPWGGNRVRILALIRALRALRWRVTVVAPPSGVTDDGREAIADRIIPIRAQGFLGGDVGRFDPTPFRRVLAEVAEIVRPSMVIAEYAWLAPAMAGLARSIVRYVDCHDVLSERTARFRAAGLDPWVMCTREQETALLASADILMAIQPREEEMLRRLMPGKRVVCLLPHIDLPPRFERSSSDRPMVLSVGANHAGNDGIRRFAVCEWPRVVERVPEASLRIVGRIGLTVDARTGVETMGTVASMDRHYADAAVVVCPIDVGTGVKIKMLEALRFGKAVVATAAAAEGIEPPAGEAWITVNTVADCAGAATDLLLDRARRGRLEDAAFDYGQRCLSWDSFLPRLKSVLPGRLRQALAAVAG